MERCPQYAVDIIGFDEHFWMFFIKQYEDSFMRDFPAKYENYKKEVLERTEEQLGDVYGGGHPAFEFLVLIGAMDEFNRQMGE